VDFFNEQLANLCLSWLNDSVFSIREAASVNLKKLVEVFGVDWARTEIIPKIMLMISQPSFNYRLTTTLAITVSTLHAMIRVSFFDFFFFLRRRGLFSHAVCSHLQAISQAVTSEVISEDLVPPLVNELCSDTIPNVRFNACKAVEILVPLLLAGGARRCVDDLIIPTLKRMEVDSDKDVRFYASQALLAGGFPFFGVSRFFVRDASKLIR
jgi:serine/threonine-protein phosphatase 2A regulatory subunit A